MKDSLSKYIEQELEKMSTGKFKGDESERKQILDIAKTLALKEIEENSERAKHDHEVVMLDKRNDQERAMEDAKHGHLTDLEQNKSDQELKIKKMELTALKDIEVVKGQAAIDVAKTAGWFSLGNSAIGGVSNVVSGGLGALGAFGNVLAGNASKFGMAKMMLNEVVLPEREGYLNIGTSTGRSMINRIGQDSVSSPKI